MLHSVPYPDAQEYLAASEHALAEHFGADYQASGRSMAREIRSLPWKGGLYVEIWLTDIPRSPLGVMLWDALLVVPPAGDEVAVHWTTDIAQWAHAELSNKSVEGRLEFPPVPLFAFHPQRFRAVMPHGKLVAQMGDRLDIGPMEIAEADMRALIATFQHAHNAASRVSPLRGRAAANDRALSRQWMDATELAVVIAEFHKRGRQIFDFPASLIEMFGRTSVEDIRFDTLHLPYRAFYLHFGLQRHIETKPGWHPDGAYVVAVPEQGGVQLALTSQPADRERYWQWVDDPEPVYIQSLMQDEMGIGVGEAADIGLAKRMARLRKEIAGSASPLETREGQALVDEAAAQGIRLTDVAKRSATITLERLPQLADAYAQTLKLIVNALAYLTAYPEDRERRIPAKAPGDLLTQASTGTPKARQRAESKLAALGYTAVHYCGRRVEEQYARVATGAGAQQSEGRKPAWVMGHWFLQAHGPQWSQHRLRWKMPHLRNAGQPRDPEAEGHIYLVSDRDAAAGDEVVQPT